jgi:predicted nucleic acid-binding protein
VIVVDASIVVNAVADDGPAGSLARSVLRDAGDVSMPDVGDAETAAVLRRLWVRDELSARRFRSAIDDLARLPIMRVPTRPLLARTYELRSNVSTFDACYVALAEALGCRLVTADRRLARAPGVRCVVDVLAD